MNRGTWWVTVHRVAESWTPLSDEYCSLLGFCEVTLEVMVTHSESSSPLAKVASLEWMLYPSSGPSDAVILIGTTESNA